MIDVRGLVQTALDTALAADGVYTYWLRKAETTGEDADEYIVFTQGNDTNTDFADDRAITKTAGITVKYYYRDTFLETYAGRTHVKGREEVVRQSLLDAGFICINGPFDAGDVDDIGFGTTIFEIEYGRLTEAV